MATHTSCFSTRGAVAAPPLTDTLSAGQKAMPSWGVSSGTFGGTPLKDSFLSPPIVMYSQSSHTWIFLFVSGTRGLSTAATSHTLDSRGTASRNKPRK